MNIGIDTMQLAQILGRLTEEQIIALFWYLFGYCEANKDEKFFDGIIERLAEPRKEGK